jgi:hypothetical protein
MTACLLHLRSAISLRHIEDDLDDFEQRLLPDEHYVLSREGYTANYVIVPDQPFERFYDYLKAASSGLRLEQLSLVEIGRSWCVSEQGCSEPCAEDACGEWRRVRNDATLAMEEVRVRTGLNHWLRRHSKGGTDLPGSPIGLFLFFHQRMEPSSRWLSNLKEALGKSARPHFRDEQSVLITTATKGGGPEPIFASERYSRYLQASLVHTAFGFSLGARQRHIAGDLQSVLPPQGRPAPNERTGEAQVRSKPIVIRGGRQNPENERLREAIAKLKASRRDWER